MPTWETPHFRADRRLRATPRVHRTATVTVVRRDSDEIVDQVRVSAPDPGSLEALVDVEVRRHLDALPPPSDWGRSPAPVRLIARWLALRDALYGAYLDRGEAAPEQRPAMRAEAERHEAAELDELARALGGLVEEELVQLFTPTPFERRDPANAWALDALSAKKSLYSLLAAPTARVAAAYEDLKVVIGADEEPEPVD